MHIVLNTRMPPTAQRTHKLKIFFTFNNNLCKRNWLFRFLDYIKSLMRFYKIAIDCKMSERTKNRSLQIDYVARKSILNSD